MLTGRVDTILNQVHYGLKVLSFSGNEFADGQKEDGDGEDQQVAVADVRGGAVVALYGDVELTAGVGGEGGLYVALRVDDGGGAGVGGAQHGAAGFQRAHLRDLQVLGQGDGVAEPGNVGDV